jgi:hypothetical protein
MGSEYLFVGLGTTEAPKVGDLRLSYSKVPTDLNVTAFGKLEDGKITSFSDGKNHTLYRIFTGSKDEAIETLHTEYTTSLWLWRLVGFVMIWIGLMLLFEPLSTLLDVLPVFGSLSRGLVGVASFIAALVLAGVTIVVSMILHSVVALIAALVIVIVVLVVGLKYFRKNKKVTK